MLAQSEGYIAWKAWIKARGGLRNLFVPDVFDEHGMMKPRRFDDDPPPPALGGGGVTA